jgi:hypothetical protein
MLLRDAYYVAKPAIPRSVRLAVRRAMARRRLRSAGSFWPIDARTGSTPDGWPGWPGGKRFAFVLTHDVEGTRGRDRCRQLAELEMALGFRSSFNFVPEGEYETPRSLREFLTTRGFEVGVHDLHHDGKLYRSREAFLRSAARINGHLASWEAVGFRSAFMLHNLEWLHALNVLYDASTFDTDPFEPQPDAAGTIFPFWVGRSGGPGRTGGPGGYVELPYTLAQDSTLFLILQERGIDIWTRKLEWVAAHGGMALVNVHPDYMTFDGGRSAGEYDAALYREFLEHAIRQYGNDAWFALPGDVARHVVGWAAARERSAAAVA